MERLVPTKLTGTPDKAYLGNLTQQVNYITGKGAYAIICPHNYGRYYGSVITDTAGFQAFWKTVATQYKANSKVIFDTNNECVLARLPKVDINADQLIGTTTWPPPKLSP